MIYWNLFLGFLQVGCLAFGGAYGAIPLIRDVVLSYGWLTDEQITYMIAVSESTPGPIMVNLATYVGSSQGGLPGAITATAAVVLPAFIIIILIMAVLKNLIRNRFVQAILNGLKPCIAGIILATGAYMLLNNCFDLSSGLSLNWRSLLLAAILIAVQLGAKFIGKKQMSPISLILISACLGIALY